MKLPNTANDILFQHFNLKADDSFVVESAKTNNIVFLTKGRAQIIYPKVSGDERGLYNTGDIAFFPLSYDFNIKILLPAEILMVSFDNNKDVFREIQKLLVVEDDSGIDEAVSTLKLKYPLNMYVMLMIRYIEDGVMNPSLSLNKLSELFFIFRKYYNEKEIRTLFSPILSASPDFKLLVYSKFKYNYNVYELADACNMGKRTFERRFREAFSDETPYSWIQNQKEKKILYKLSLAGVSIKDVLEEFNFYDSSHFNKFCKQRYGKTPEELVKSLKEK